MSEEVELKLSLPESARPALLRHPLLRSAERLPARKLVNVYYDTPGLALHRRGIALRTRRQGRRWLQTVKCAGRAAGGLAMRPEWEQPFRAHFDFAAIDDPQVRAQLERHRHHLAPAFETVFVRRSWRHAPAPGITLLLMLDQGWIEAGGRREPLCELEIELERGPAGAVFDVALALAQTIPLRPDDRSKAERGYALRSGAAPRLAASAPPARPSGTRPDTPPHEAFRAIAGACLAHYLANESGEWGAPGEEPEFVHQMRVALRRWRAALRAFRPVLPEGFGAAAVAPLRPLMAALGAMRDWDVLATAIVAPVQAAFPDDVRLAALAEAVARQRRTARDSLAHALAAPATGAALIGFGARLHSLAADADAPSLRTFAGQRLDRLYRKVRAHAARAGDPASLHALRIAVKRLRYALEGFESLLYPGAARAALRALRRLQDTLGALNDLGRAGTLLAACLADDPGLGEAIALAGGWHGPRHAALLARLPRQIARLKTMKRIRLRAQP